MPREIRALPEKVNFGAPLFLSSGLRSTLLLMDRQQALEQEVEFLRKLVTSQNEMIGKQQEMIGKLLAERAAQALQPAPVGIPYPVPVPMPVPQPPFPSVPYDPPYIPIYPQTPICPQWELAPRDGRLPEIICHGPVQTGPMVPGSSEVVSTVSTMQ